MTRLAPGGLPPEANWLLYASYERRHLCPLKKFALASEFIRNLRKKPCRFVIPAKAKREPASKKGRRLNSLGFRLRLRLSAMTAAAIRWRVRQTRLAFSDKDIDQKS